MQTIYRNRRPRSTQSQQYQKLRKQLVPEDGRRTLLILGALCLLLPPVGTLLALRSEKINSTLRVCLSAVAVAAMTFFFCLFLRPESSGYDNRPVPITPAQAGYATTPGSVAPAQPAAIVPVQPAVPQFTEAPVTEQDVPAGAAALSDDTTVYALAENATNFHLYETCEDQINGRALTLRQALDEGLTPCPKCVNAAG